VHSGLLPLVVAFLVTGALRLVFGPARGAQVACAGVGFGLFAGYLATLGLPAWPPLGALQKLAVIAIAGLALGLALDLMRAEVTAVRLLGVLALVAALAWVFEVQVRQADTRGLVEPALLAAGGALVLWRLAGRRGEGAQPAVAVIVAALGLAGIALVSASLSIAQLAGALAAAVGGFTLWSWPVARFPFAASGTFAALVPLLALAAITTLLTKAPAWVLAPLLLVFFADLVSGRLPAGSGRWREALQPVYLGLIAALPAALAVALAIFAAGSGGDADLYLR
jgi:hypothetical protein